MTRKKLKPTAGPWYYNSVDEWDHSVVTHHGETDDGSTRLWTVASANTIRDEKEDNARLIAEAGTVFHECGLSPRELLKGYRNLQTAISDYLERQDELDNREHHGINAEPHDTLMRRRNYARDDLDSALTKLPLEEVQSQLVSRADELAKHLRDAHAFIENTEAFGHRAGYGILECGGCSWNIDESKAALAKHKEV